MDLQTLNRDKGDLNVNVQTQKSNEKHISIQSSSISEKTQSLSIISINETQLVLKDILALEGQIDNNLFNEESKFQFIISERLEFQNIEQIINQRILIEDSQNCSIYYGMMISSQQQIVIKDMLFSQQEQLIQIFDEFKIQNKLNNLFPKQSLLLYTPVRVQKHKQSYLVKAAMEKAETNLFLYSKKNIITKNQAYTIYRLILKQLIDMHSIKIAHRDVKPQNIFYLNNKGWLLSDFGESSEYEELEQFYNIRGTLYFLMPYIKSQVNRRKQVLQNLLANDLYALVVTIIIIQKIHEIDLIDIQHEINILTDPYLIKTLNIKTYQDLIQFEQDLDDIKEEIQYNANYNCFKQFSPREEQYNKGLKYYSWVQLCSYYIEKQIFPDITTQLFQLIIDNIDKISECADYLQGNMLSKLKVGGKLIPINPLLIPRDISRFNIKQIELAISLLFNYGYSERTIQYCQQVLANQYNQFIHLKLIDSLERLLMYSEAQQQFNIIQQGLVFEPLDSEFQDQFLLKLQYYGFDGQKLEDLQISKYINTINDSSFQQDLNKYEQFDIQNTQLIINLFEKQIKQYCSKYDIFSIGYFFHLFGIVTEYNINISYETFRRIYILRLGVLEMVRRESILFEMAQICILHEDMAKFRQNVKILHMQIFKTESLQQNIVLKIQSLVLKIIKLCNKKSTHLIIYKLYQQIQKIKLVSYNIYKVLIQEYLLSFLKQLFFGNFDYLSPLGVKVVVFIIDYIYNNMYYKENFNNFQFYHVRTQNILVKQLNLKRKLKLIRDNQDQLNNQSKNYFNHYSFNIFMNRKSFNQMPELEKQRQFIFEQYLQKE